VGCGDGIEGPGVGLKTGTAVGKVVGGKVGFRVGKGRGTDVGEGRGSKVGSNVELGLSHKKQTCPRVSRQATTKR